MRETVFLDLQNTRYRWENTGNRKTKISTTQIETSDFSIDIISEDKLILQLKLKIKVLFLDLRNTLVSRDNITKKFIAFPETDTILSNLKGKGLEIGIISDGNRSQLNAWLADPTIK